MQEEETKETLSTDQEPVTSFQWKYIFLPVNILVLSLVLIGIFVTKLPAEAAYTFDFDGLPTRTMDGVQLAIWLGVIQIVLTLGAVFVTRLVGGLFNRFVQPHDLSLSPSSVISVMGNIIGLPQVIIFFAMADIFSYNSYETHLLPLWLNAIIFLLAGGIILSIFFLRAFLHIRRSYKE